MRASCTSTSNPEQLADGQPRLVFDPDGLRQNCRVIVEACTSHGISVAGVTKGVSGDPRIAQFMLQSGIRILADARVENLECLRRAGVDAPMMLLRPPSLAGMPNAAAVADIFLMSDKSSLDALSKACRSIDKIADAIVMVDLGDLREGVTPDQLPDIVEFTQSLSNVRVAGIGTNHACHIGVMPDHKNMAVLSTLVQQVEAQLGYELEFVSAGNSSAFELAQSGALPANLNLLRLGESILLGLETSKGQKIPGTRQDNFALIAQVIEMGWKYFDTQRERGSNALGEASTALVSGDRRVALLNVGAVDVAANGLTPLDPNIRILGASSDHLVLDATDADNLAVGSEVAFALNYHALSTAASSPYLTLVPGSAPG